MGQTHPDSNKTDALLQASSAEVPVEQVKLPSEINQPSAPPLASPTTSSRLGANPPSTSWVSQQTATDSPDRGTGGLENPFELIDASGESLPVWKSTRQVPLIANRSFMGKQEGDAFGAEPEAALRYLNAKEAQLDARAVKLCGEGSMGRFLTSTLRRELSDRYVADGRIAGDGRDENGRVVEGVAAGRPVSVLRGDGAVRVGNDGRDEHGRVLADVGGPASYPGRGEPLPSGSGPQPAKTNPTDSHVNAHPESKVIPTPEEVGTEKAKQVADDETTLNPDERRRLYAEAKYDATREGLKGKLAEDKANRPNETAGREKGDDVTSDETKTSKRK